MPETLSGLEAYATEELIAELYSRYDCAVFAGLRDLTSDEQENDYGFVGGATTAKGLTGDLLDYIKEQQTIRRQPEHLGDWDDAEDA
jgi:hypothetical protein